jgi:hypothetical protein
MVKITDNWLKLPEAERETIRKVLEEIEYLSRGDVGNLTRRVSYLFISHYCAVLVDKLGIRDDKQSATSIGGEDREAGG